ncbi:hypothetical protein MYX76_02420 [Desulfobacterota bacterium AH_259_B03_O07]|nr:hypothetical protein [Desulfobacterota bacterium AH_259_B03_O07]
MKDSLINSKSWMSINEYRRKDKFLYFLISSCNSWRVYCHNSGGYARGIFIGRVYTPCHATCD